MNLTDLQSNDAPLASLVVTHDTYWCIEPASGLSLWRQLQKETVNVHVAAFAQAQAAQSAKESDTQPKRKPYKMQGRKAVLSLTGTLTKAPTSFEGGTSTVYFRRMIGQAANDPDVSEIVLLIDSPGGSAAGTADAAAAVAMAAQKKPVIAYCEDMCCSAAYWIASQASKVVANPTAMVGSIGTLLVIYDMSRMAAKEGVEPLVFSTGPLKGAGVPGTVITDEQKSHFQRIVDDLNSHFLSAVQSGRALSDEQISAVSTAEVWIGEAAKQMGLVDEIASLDTVLAEAGSGDIAAGRGKRRETTMFRAAMARTLAALGFSGIAGAMLTNQSEEPEAVASDLAAHLKNEVQSQVAAHPLIGALATYGITTKAHLDSLIADAQSYREEAQQSLQTEAIRAFGQEAGMQKVSAMASLPASDKRAMAEGFAAVADAKFGTTAENGPARVSAPKPLATAQIVNDAQPQSAWEQLTPAQQAQARKLKLDATPEKREAYAKNLLNVLPAA